MKDLKRLIEEGLKDLDLREQPAPSKEEILKRVREIERQVAATRAARLRYFDQ